MKQVAPEFVDASTGLSSDCAAAAQRPGIPVCLHVHEAQPLSEWALRRSGEDVRALPMVAPSRFVAREMADLTGSPVPTLLGPIRSMGATAGHTANYLPWTEGSVHVVGRGSVAPWKGPEQWLAAAEEVSVVDGRKVEWMWVGSGDQLPKLRDETHRRGLDGRVHWIGEREDIAPYLASADLLVLTSENGPRGLVLLEAAAVGPASVAFRTGGVPEILVDERALVRPGDVGEFVEEVRAVIGSQVLRAGLPEAARPAHVEVRSVASGATVPECGPSPPPAVPQAMQPGPEPFSAPPRQTGAWRPARADPTAVA